MTIVDKIASTLGETEEEPLKVIDRLVKILGEESALDLLEETLKIEAEGGMQTDDGSRQRSIGGIFFKLAKNKTTSKQRWLIFNPNQSTKKKKKGKQQVQTISWEVAKQIAEDILKTSPGEASTVKATIVGRPGRVVEKSDVVVTSMQSGKAPSLPKGLPQPPSEPTTYLIFIAMKQWRKVKASINKNPDDRLIVEGYPIFDQRIGQPGTMTIYAQSVTTKLIQQAKREVQKAAPKS